MQHSPGSAPKTEDVLRGLAEHKRLVAVVSALVREVERLSEDNRQLRAAVAMYREVTDRRTTSAPPESAT